VYFHFATVAPATLLLKKTFINFRSPARQALSFDDLVMKPKPCIPETIEDSVLDMSQQLRLLLKVAA